MSDSIANTPTERVCRKCSALFSGRYCAACARARNAANRAANPEKVRAANAKYRCENKEKALAYGTAYRANNPDKFVAPKAKWRAANRAATRAKNAAYRAANPEKEKAKSARYAAENPEKTQAKNAMRRARKLQATPCWFGELDEFVAHEAYSLARLRRKHTGVNWHVDHVVPFCGALVCGLHVGANLAVIPAVENIRKAARFNVATQFEGMSDQELLDVIEGTSTRLDS